MHPQEEVGDLTISYKKANLVAPLSVTLNNIPANDFMTLMKTGADSLQPVGSFSIFSPSLPYDARKTETDTKSTAKIVDIEARTVPKDAFENRPQDEGDIEQETEMSDLSRNEMQALLKANKAEVDAVASRMQADMAKWRELMASDMKEMKHLVVTQHEKINSRLDVQSTRIESALDSHSRKIDAALSVQEAKLEGKLSDVKLEIIKWALGLPALAFTVYKIYGAISGNPTP